MLAGPHVPRPHPTRHGFLGDAPVGDLRAVDQLVADDYRRRVDRVQQGVQVVTLRTVGARQADHGVDHAALAEVVARLARLRRDAYEVAVAGAPVDAFVAVTVGPVRDAALAPRTAHGRRALFVALRVEHPERPAGGRIDRHALRQRRVEVEHAADHQRSRLKAGGAGPVARAVQVRRLGLQRVDNRVERRPPLAAARGRLADELVDEPPAPGDFEVAEVIAVDLGERRVPGAGDVAGEAAPFPVLGPVLLPGLRARRVRQGGRQRSGRAGNR